MTDKLEALSQPAAYEVKGCLCHTIEEAEIYVGQPEPLYSQEYVTALLDTLRNLYASCDTGQRRGNGSQCGFRIPDWETVEAARQLLKRIDSELKKGQDNG